MNRSTSQKDSQRVCGIGVRRRAIETGFGRGGGCGDKA